MEPLSNLDVVYFVKESTTNEELIYSIRSVVANFPHRKIWIYGGKPSNLSDKNFIKIKQSGDTKWDRVRGMFTDVCLNKEITDDFYLFNDDFFVINPVVEMPVYHRSSLAEHIITIEQKYKDVPTAYTKQLRNCYRRLTGLGYPTLSYELHVPFLFNKGKLLQIMGAFPDVHCSRTLYGNFFELDSVQHDDVKVYDYSKTFDKGFNFLSTEDTSWGPNIAGVKTFIKDRFPKKSEYEL